METSNYWDLDDILAEEERVVVRFNAPSARNGFLDPSQFSDPAAEVPESTVMEMPLWMATKLAQCPLPDNETAVSIETSKGYKTEF